MIKTQVNHFRRYFLYRSALFTTLLGITLLFLKQSEGLVPLLILTSVFIIDEILVYSFQKGVYLFNILIDFAYLSIFIVFTGGSLSPFVPFYLPLTVLGAYLFFPLDSFIVAGCSAAFYGVISLVLAGRIPESLLLIEVPELPSLPEALLGFIVYSLSFLFTAALSSFIIQRLRKENVRLRVTTSDILEAIDYGIITVNEDGNIVWSNSKAASILGGKLPSNENLSKIVHNEFLEPMSKILKREKKEVELRVEDKVYKIRGNDLFDGEGTILMINDTTKEREMERKMQMQEKLVTLGQFAANLAHGVRNPVSSIRASAELIDTKVQNPKKNNRLRELIIEESDHLENLINNFLDFTRNFKLKKEEINLHSLTNEVIPSLKRSKYFHDKVRIINKIDKGLKIKGDYTLLKNVLINLGTNSLKAMRDGGNLIFDVTMNEKITIVIEDTGCGIKKEDLDRIFSPFYSSFNDGFGFGLSIVKKIVELHNWDIKAESKLGGGTKFRIIL